MYLLKIVEILSHCEYFPVSIQPYMDMWESVGMKDQPERNLRLNMWGNKCNISDSLIIDKLARRDGSSRKPRPWSKLLPSTHSKTFQKFLSDRLFLVKINV